MCIFNYYSYCHIEYMKFHPRCSFEMLTYLKAPFFITYSDIQTVKHMSVHELEKENAFN